MAVTVKRDMRLVRLIDSVNDNPLELTIGAGTEGRVSLHLEDRDAGSMTASLTLDAAELRAALAVLEVEHGVYFED